ncbi:uncharacterized protein DS421_6g188650 [Arachis hypogaea]|nr:uncharacterized protein DS421_6g188650 [Arachis hypogaea]
MRSERKRVEEGRESLKKRKGRRGRNSGAGGKGNRRCSYALPPVLLLEPPPSRSSHHRAVHHRREDAQNRGREPREEKEASPSVEPASLPSPSRSSGRRSSPLPSRRQCRSDQRKREKRDQNGMEGKEATFAAVKPSMPLLPSETATEASIFLVSSSPVLVYLPYLRCRWSLPELTAEAAAALYFISLLVQVTMVAVKVVWNRGCGCRLDDPGEKGIQRV